MASNDDEWSEDGPSRAASEILRRMRQRSGAGGGTAGSRSGRGRRDGGRAEPTPSGGAGDSDEHPGLARAKTGAGPSRWDPQQVGSVVGALIDKGGWNRPVAMGGLVARWGDIVGEDVARHCQVESFHDSILEVRADSTAWAKQVQLLLPQLERRIDEEVGAGVVTQVIVRGPAAPSWKRGPLSVPGRGPRDTYG